MTIRKTAIQLAVAAALLATSMPASAGTDTVPVLESADFTSSAAHEMGFFDSIDRPLTVVVGTDPAVGDNTYGYLMVRYMKWNAKRDRWVAMRRSGEYPKGWSPGYWNSETQRFEAPFVNARKKGRCKVIAKYRDTTTDPTDTKDKKRFRCRRGFGTT